MGSLFLRRMAQASFDQSEPSTVPSKQLFRTGAIIETLLWIGKS
jgi:hypothetical protein